MGGLEEETRRGRLSHIIITYKSSFTYRSHQYQSGRLADGLLRMHEGNLGVMIIFSPSILDARWTNNYLQLFTAFIRPPGFVFFGLKLSWLQKPFKAFSDMNEYEMKGKSLLRHVAVLEALCAYGWLLVGWHRETRQTHTIYIRTNNLYHSLLLCLFLSLRWDDWLSPPFSSLLIYK